jgi:hypothetical protein
VLPMELPAGGEDPPVSVPGCLAGQLNGNT